ncbi:MAG: 16S rRNA (uracil(1498)-N(3))-methyltransferase [Myxococcales bacterium]|nr:16S rRNA (uracil(1498)-N(3))-methyltransferase [Myxococcales bacterium]
MTTRLPIAPERIQATLPLVPRETHYLIDVLRLGDGADIEVFDGLGGRYRARLNLENASLELGERLPDLEEPSRLSIAPALLKNDKLDWVIEKATELGTMRIEPFRSINCVVKLDESKAIQRRERWQKIAAAASRQCGRAFIPEVQVPASLTDVVRGAHDRGELAIVLFEREIEHAFCELIPKIDSTQSILIVTGPEGGFRDDEIEAVRALGARTSSLGKRILRAETAPIAALAVAQGLRGQM